MTSVSSRAPATVQPLGLQMGESGNAANIEQKKVDGLSPGSFGAPATKPAFSFAGLSLGMSSASPLSSTSSQSGFSTATSGSFMAGSSIGTSTPSWTSSFGASSLGPAATSASSASFGSSAAFSSPFGKGIQFGASNASSSGGQVFGGAGHLGFRVAEVHLRRVSSLPLPDLALEEVSQHKAPVSVLDLQQQRLHPSQALYLVLLGLQLLWVRGLTKLPSLVWVSNLSLVHQR